MPLFSCKEGDGIDTCFWYVPPAFWRLSAIQSCILSLFFYRVGRIPTTGHTLGPLKRFAMVKKHAIYVVIAPRSNNPMESSIALSVF
jgi:hypothetical protein